MGHGIFIYAMFGPGHGRTLNRPPWHIVTDVLAMKDPDFVRGNFCEVILGSAWDS